MPIRILYLVVALLFVPGLVYANQPIKIKLPKRSGQFTPKKMPKTPKAPKTPQTPQTPRPTNIGSKNTSMLSNIENVPTINKRNIATFVEKSLAENSLLSGSIPAEVAQSRSISPIDYTLEEKATFPLFLETLVKNSLFHMYNSLMTPQWEVMEYFFDVFPDKTIPLTKLFHRLGIKDSKIRNAAKNYPEVIQFLNNHPNYEAVEGEELPDFIEPLLRATFPLHRHGYVQENPEGFMGQLFKLFPKYKISLTKMFLSRGANGVEILEAAEHDPEIARFLFASPGIVYKALQKRRIVEVSRPDDYLFGYRQLHFMQAGLEANPDRVAELLGFFRNQGAPWEELLYISVAYPEIVKSMLHDSLSEDVKSSIAWNAIKYNYQETALLFATDNRAIAMLGAYAALLEKWDFMERILREYPQVTSEDIFQALLERRPLPWGGRDIPSYYQPGWSDLYGNGEKRNAIIEVAKRYHIDLDARGIGASRY